MLSLFKILSFAAVACRLFQHYEPFYHLSIAWLSLFKLSTTVVNPSIWMPIYQETKFSALFFVLFIIVTVFYMHSLVLSVVFQTYIQAATEIHDRSVTDREDALQLAYAALKKQQQHNLRRQQTLAGGGNNEPVPLSSEQKSAGIPLHLVRETLEVLRPHYSALKVRTNRNIVVDIRFSNRFYCMPCKIFKSQLSFVSDDC